MKNKKLLFVVNVDWYFKLHWINRALAAKSEGYDIYIVTSFTDTRVKSELENYGFFCHEINFSRSGLNIINEFISGLRLYRLLKIIKPDLIHTITIKPNIYGGICAKILSIPSIKSVTGTGIIFSSHSVFFSIIRCLITILYKFSSANATGCYIFENKEDQLLFSKLKIIQKQKSMHIAGAGVDHHKFAFVDNLFSSHKINVLFAARLLKDKGLDDLLKAVHLARNNGVEVEIYIAGLFDQEARNAYSLNEILKLTEAEYIHWLGSRNDLEILLQNIDVVALPTRYGEGIPRILIEAGSTGRVVITTNTPGCRELIKDNESGYLVPVNNSLAIAACLKDIKDNPEKAKNLANKLHKDILNEYTDDIVIFKFLNVYNEMIIS